MYCYKCGVKLSDSLIKCPLCHSKLPYHKLGNEKLAYSTNIEEIKKHIDFRYIARLILLVLCFLGIITFLCNFIINGQVTWSIYVLSSIVYLASQVSFFYFKNKLVAAIINLFGLEYLLFTIAYMTNGLNWYLYLVMPNIFIVWLLIVLCIYFFSKKKRRLTRGTAVILLLLSIILVVTEVLIDLYKYQVINLKWSLYASLPILIVSLIIFVISFNRRLIEEIKRRIFI
jgi:hypothetical protein